MYQSCAYVGHQEQQQKNFLEQVDEYFFTSEPESGHAQGKWTTEHIHGPILMAWSLLLAHASNYKYETAEGVKNVGTRFNWIKTLTVIYLLTACVPKMFFV